uniref:GIR1-like zinc ribbon domain-containing protein n=1 Tax=Populus trichocarpa TaxID=3694 RepID=B9NB04_POPTR
MFLQSTEKVYSQRCNSVSSSLPSLNITKHHHKQRTTQESEVQDSKSPPLRERPPPTPPASDIKEDEISTTFSSTGVFAAACPGCLLYVITLKTNPKCPSCNFTVPSPLVTKKPRIDLNASL